jgi:hypothetical protein
MQIVYRADPCNELALSIRSGGKAALPDLRIRLSDPLCLWGASAPALSRVKPREGFLGERAKGRRDRLHVVVSAFTQG